MGINKFNVGPIEIIAELIGFYAVQTNNELIAYAPLPAVKASKGYPITCTEDE